jgi:hypothetical protein
MVIQLVGPNDVDSESQIDVNIENSPVDKKQIQQGTTYCLCCVFPCTKTRLITGITATLIALAVLLYSAVFIGSTFEMSNMNSSPSTLYFYNTSEVCAVDAAGGWNNYVSPIEAAVLGDKIAHCGQCGECR